MFRMYQLCLLISQHDNFLFYQKVAWDYFRRTYPDPIGNEKAEQLLAFLLGMTSHQVGPKVIVKIASKQSNSRKTKKVDTAKN